MTDHQIAIVNITAHKCMYSLYWVRLAVIRPNSSLRVTVQSIQWPCLSRQTEYDWSYNLGLSVYLRSTLHLNWGMWEEWLAHETNIISHSRTLFVRPVYIQYYALCTFSLYVLCNFHMTYPTQTVLYIAAEVKAAYDVASTNIKLYCSQCKQNTILLPV